MLVHIPTIIATCESFFAEFISDAVDSFFSELNLYIRHNEDDMILDYANEQTLCSLFVNGIIRNDSKKHTITAVQEYGSYSKIDSRHGRTDLFMKVGDTGIWIEAKYDKYHETLDKNHWNIESWLQWDDKIFGQVMDYYNMEIDQVNPSYKEFYVMTLVFKKIREHADLVKDSANTELKINSTKDYVRPWYYSVGFFEYGNKDKVTGVEIYGTFKKMKNSMPNPIS